MMKLILPPPPRYLLLVIFLITGCASIVSETLYPISINSSPDGSLFEITNENGLKVHNGRTPATVILDAHNGFFDGATYQIKFKKEGFYEQESTISSSLDGWYLGNLLFGGLGLVGLLIVDPATGAMWKLPSYHAVSLTEKDLSVNNSEKTLRILSVNELPVQYRDKLIPIRN